MFDFLLSEENDIAVLKIKNPPVILPVIPLMRPWRLLLGETVIAVGNPFGLDGTITVGILSGINRSLADGSRLIFSDLLQTDAAVFPGNSGGPLINLDGCMIGMNIAVKRNSPGISFAMPLHRIENVLAKYFLPERFSNLNFGIVPSVDLSGNVIVDTVLSGSPAEEAGIRAGMKILSFQGWNPENDLLSLSRRMIRLKAGERINIKFREFGTVKLKPVPFHSGDGEKLAQWKLGISVEELNSEKADALRYPFRQGIIVSGIVQKTDSPFKRGDIIAELNGKRIQSMQDFSDVLSNVKSGEKLSAIIYSLMEDPVNGRFLGKRNLQIQIK